MAGEDFFATRGRLVFPPGTTNEIFAVPVIGDTVYENLETFFVNLSAPSNAAVAIGQGRGRILNDDPLPGLVIADTTVAEAPVGTTTDAIFSVRLAGLTSLPATVNFATRDGTAISDVDYIAQSGLVTFAPGVTNQTIVVTINGNSTVKSNATFSVILSNPLDVSIGNAQGVCTIQNPASALRLMAVFNGTTLRLSFPTVVGKSYRLERTDDLQINLWTVLADNVVGTGTIAQFSDIPANGSRSRFYRVRTLP